MRCLIVGSGNMSRGLARQYQIHCSANFAYHMAVARSSRGKETGEDAESFFHPGVPYVDMELALEMADIVILAIPSAAFQTFVAKYFDKLSRCILVDISNPTKRGENLASTIQSHRRQQKQKKSPKTPHESWSNLTSQTVSSSSLASGPDMVTSSTNDQSSSPILDATPETIDESQKKIKQKKIKIRWVKAFNDCGAIDLLSKNAISKARFTTCMCGNDSEAVRAVKKYAEEAMGFNVVTYPESYVDELEEHQSTLGRCWILASMYIMGIFTAAYAYVVVYFVAFGGVSPDQLPLFVTNKAIAFTAVAGFAWVQLPGIVAKMLITWNKFVKRNRNYELPGFLVTQLLIRKHIGLLALFFVAVHAIMGTLIFNEVYSTRSFNASSGLLHATASWSMFFGIIGFMLYLVVSIASIPGVSTAMTSKQFRFCFGVVIWVALVFGLIHIIAIGGKGWTDKENWPGGLPPISLMSSIFPLTVVFLKVVQECFCRYIPIYYS